MHPWGTLRDAHNTHAHTHTLAIMVTHKWTHARWINAH